MNVRDSLRSLLVDLASDWRQMRLADLQFWHRDEARLLLVSIAAVTLLILVGRLLLPRRPRSYTVAVPAVLVSMPSLASWLTRVPLLIALVGLPFLAVAIADPYTSLVRSEASYPGRRICLMIDASNSMSSPFQTRDLPKRADGGESNAFVTTVAAAERFVQMRMSGPYRDLLALVEFGADAYVVTPFTNDYDNILVSLSLIGEPHEFASFPDQRTLIAKGIEEAVALFKAFKFLDASGNLLLIFSDGEDTNAVVDGKSLDEIIRGAVDAGVPVYFIRTNYAKAEGDPAVPDKLWREAVQKTGGRFFAASDERTLLNAIDEIDRVAAGNIRVTEYSAARPRFPFFAAVAALCFALAAVSKLAVPYFQKFP